MGIEVPVNYLAVLVAAIVSMVVGYLWYGPLFGKTWMALSGMTREKVDAAKTKGMQKMYLIQFVGSLVMACVLAQFIIFAGSYSQTEGIATGLTAGFLGWLGFIAPVTLGMVLWDGKPWKLWLLNNGHQLLSLLLMGAVLGSWQ